MTSILIVEDDLQFRNLISDHFEGLGYEIYLASNGKEAFSLFTENEPDVVVCDIRLPKEDGLEFLLRTRGWDKFKCKGVILISGKENTSGNDYREIVKNLGASDFLQKPFTLKSLEEKITQIL